MTRRKDGRPKRAKDRNAPKQPNTSYTIFFKQAFRDYAEAHPGEDRKRITAVVAERWRSMPVEEKKTYEEAATKEREQYEKELSEYKKSDSYKQFVGKVKEAEKIHRKEKHYQARLKIGDIPIFSKEFINYNKARETELRSLRREISTFEEEVESLSDNIGTLQKRIKSVRDDIDIAYQTENAMNKAVESWHRTALKAIKDANLLGTLELTTSSSADELISKLETHSSNAALRRCISACRFS